MNKGDKTMRDFYHTGLDVSKSEIRQLLDMQRPTKKLFVRKGSGVAVPVSGVYEAGSDNNDGLTWDTAFATIAKAISTANGYINWSASPWAPNIEIHIASGSYAENLTSLPYGGSLIGHGDAFDADGERGVRIKPASGSPVDVNACINMLAYNINFESADTSRVFDAAILNNVQLIHCRFAGAAEATTSTAGIYTNDSVMLTVRDCRIQYVDCGIDFVYADGGDSCTRLSVKDSELVYISEAGIRWSANLVTPACTVGPNNVIHGGGQTLAVGLDDNSGQDNIGVFGNFINATDDIQGLTTNIGGNYIGGSSVE